jgi:hypothetical protein
LDVEPRTSHVPAPQLTLCPEASVLARPVTLEVSATQLVVLAGLPNTSLVNTRTVAWMADALPLTWVREYTPDEELVGAAEKFAPWESGIAWDRSTPFLRSVEEPEVPTTAELDTVTQLSVTVAENPGTDRPAITGKPIE